MRVSAAMKLFTQINEDCRKSGQQVVPFSDIEFYAEQVYNLTDEGDMHHAKRVAKAMARRSKRRSL